VKSYAALDVRTADPDLLLAMVDGFNATAAEEHDASLRIFFLTAADRDAASAALAARFDVTDVEVSDEDWARRSQENLKPVTVGRIIVAPPWSVASSPASARDQDKRAPARLAEAPEARRRRPPAPSPEASAIVIVIAPSMGFGTGHHSTTRLCLAALQQEDLTHRVVLDVGTGSGVLAIAADRLGAARVVGIDYDPDAIQCARENLELNPAAGRVSFELVELSATALPIVDVVTANLTGALLVRASTALLGAVRAGGTLILSGVLGQERDEVCDAFAPAAVVWEREEDGWVGLILKVNLPAPSQV
jgi:ribosomal protein L11 methyltransferase